MSFGRFKRFFRRLFDRSGNEVSLGDGAEYLVPKEAQVRNTVVRIHGKSKLIVEPGACVGDCSFQIDSGSTVVIAAGTTGLRSIDLMVIDGRLVLGNVIVFYPSKAFFLLALI